MINPERPHESFTTGWESGGGPGKSPRGRWATGWTGSLASHRTGSGHSRCPRPSWPSRIARPRPLSSNDWPGARGLSIAAPPGIGYHPRRGRALHSDQEGVDEEQYSIWPLEKENAPGWRDAGKTGTKSECLARIKEVWTDMRPKSLRDRMDRLSPAPGALSPKPALSRTTDSSRPALIRSASVRTCGPR